MLKKLLIFKKLFVIISTYFNLAVLLKRESIMLSLDVTIVNDVGLHARPATFFIQQANTFKSSIWIEKEDRRVNAKSLLGVLSMGIVKGTVVTLIADGEDEAEALSGLEQLIVSELND